MNARNTLTVFASLIAAMSPFVSQAHSENGVSTFKEYKRPLERKILDVPDLGNYLTLKCDLHMHTVFSDGLVWPSIRVQEAWQEGLDAIAITDHIEYQPHAADLPTNHNRAYEIAKDYAESANLLLVQGSELTRTTPPGHFNAIFINDASGFVPNREEDNPELDWESINLAAEQNAFITWNHPGWKVDQIEGSYEWIPFVDEVFEAGKLHGIEVINAFDLYHKALDWALEYNLAVLGTTDTHNVVANEYDMQRGIHRSMTLVFAKDRSLEGLREALEEQRTVAWSTRHLAGPEKWVRALYEAAVSTGNIHSTDRRGNALAEIRNNSDLYFELERIDPELESWPESISLHPQTIQLLKVGKNRTGNSAQYRVTNAFIGGNENLVVDLTVGPSE